MNEREKLSISKYSVKATSRKKKFILEFWTAVTCNCPSRREDLL